MNDKINDVLTTKKTVFGFHVADLHGIALMVIPCLISLMHFPWFEKAVSWLPGWVPFNQREVEKQVLLPNMTTGLLATVFYYGAFIARYDIFKTPISKFFDLCGERAQKGCAGERLVS